MTKVPGGEVNLKTAEVADILGMSIVEILNAQATQGAGHAVANINANGSIDTGFMINATGPILVGEDGPPAHQQTLADKSGERVDRKALEGPKMGERESSAYCGADYAYWVEREAPFMAQIGDQVQQDMDSIVAGAKPKE